MLNSQSLQISQQQSLQLTPVQLQGLQLLTAPITELENILTNELANNPLLEISAPAREELAGDPFGDAAAAGNTLDRSEMEFDNEEFPLLEKFSENWDEADYTADYSAQAPDQQKKLDYQLDSLPVQQTLVDMLFEQLNFLNLPPDEYLAAENLIGSLDENGFLATHLADVAMSCDLPLATVEKALALVQSFDPPGVGARNMAESLTLQLKRIHYPNEKIYLLLNDFQEELARNKLPQIARAMGIELNELLQMLEDLKKLNPVPAANSNINSRNITVLPEMSIELENDQIKVSGREQQMPRLSIVSRYLKMLDDPTTDEETRHYLREKLASAENLIKSLALRQDTLSRITNLIADKQEAFFRYGVEKLLPMTMAELAGELELHETTVSRAVSGKYLDTPQGLLEYKFFFSSGYKDAGGNDVSSRGIKEKIRELIDNEDPRKPLSDAALSKLLSDDGVEVARRTVAKYRESMNIPPTNLRKKH